MALHRLRPSCLVVSFFLCLLSAACARELTPEERQQLISLKDELSNIRVHIEAAKKLEETYTGGLIKSLVAVRLELLKINEALVEQRIHTLESGAKMSFVVNVSKTDPERATELAKEIEAQKIKLLEAQAEASAYAGGLIKTMAEVTVATIHNTLALMEQQSLSAKYGLILPPPQRASLPPEISTKESAEGSHQSASPPTLAPKEPSPSQCLSIAALDASVLSRNQAYVELNQSTKDWHSEVFL